MSSFAEFCIIALAPVIFAEVYVSIYDLSLEKSLPIGAIGRVAFIGILLTLNEYLFFKYLKKVVLRKQFPFNDDFIGLWLEITNILVAFCLAGVSTYSAEYVKRSGNPLWPSYHSIK